jgi:hypothetical protein
MAKKHGGKISPTTGGTADGVVRSYTDDNGDSIVDIERESGNAMYLARTRNGQVVADCFAHAIHSSDIFKDKVRELFAGRADMERQMRAGIPIEEQVDTSAFGEVYKLDPTVKDGCAVSSNVYMDGKPIIQSSHVAGKNGENLLAIVHGDGEQANAVSRTHIYESNVPGSTRFVMEMSSHDGRNNIDTQIVAAGKSKDDREVYRSGVYSIDEKIYADLAGGDLRNERQVEGIEAVRKEYPLPEGMPFDVDAPIPESIHAYRIDEDGKIGRYSFVENDGKTEAVRDDVDMSRFEAFIKYREQTTGLPSAKAATAPARGTEIETQQTATNEDVEIDI